jgi:multidrug resistance protein, MATE family
MSIAMRLPSRAELTAMTRLAMPIVLAQVGLMSMGVVDTIMVGRVSAAALAAVALGNLYFYTVSTAAAGTLLVLDPIISQAAGARDGQRIALGVQRGLVLALLLAVPTALLLWPVRVVLALFRQPPELIDLAESYVRISIVGLLPFLGFVVLRQTLQALHRVRALVLVVVTGNLVNAGLNWVLVYGHLGARPMEVSGSAWATAVARWAMTLLLFAGGWRVLRAAVLPWRREAFQRASLARMLRLGWTIGLQQVLEFGVFAAIGLLMGVLGTPEMAAHEIALTLASLTFMVPLGFGAAAAVRVGRAVGEGNRAAAGERARTALVCGVGFMLCTAVIMLVFPGAIAAAYTNQPVVATIAASLIPIAGMFQLFDGIQAVSAGVLRGLGDTRAPFVVNLAGFWLCGFPVSVALAFHTPLRALGLWWGLAAGLAVVASLLLLRVRSRLRGPLVQVEHVPAGIAASPAADG